MNHKYLVLQHHKCKMISHHSSHLILLQPSFPINKQSIVSLPDINEKLLTTITKKIAFLFRFFIFVLEHYISYLIDTHFFFIVVMLISC
jgi:hypothetical protein